MKRIIVALAILVGVSSLLAAEDKLKVQIGSAFDVAPNVEGTRSQGWASVAWAEVNKCWLVAWREGFLNEDACDIWCGRVDADGKPIDPKGIRLTAGKGIVDEPKVASDGKEWLVVWHDLSNGKDWDVRGVIVSADGKPRGEPFTIAGGEHNQCVPAVAFAGGNYHVIWAGFSGNGIPGDAGSGYGLWGVRVSCEGKVVGEPVELVSNKDSQSVYPSAAGGDDVVMVTFRRQGLKGPRMWNRIILDAGTMKIVKNALPVVRDAKGEKKEFLQLDGQKISRLTVPVAYGGGVFLSVAQRYTVSPLHQIGLLVVSKDGELKEGDTAEPWAESRPTDHWRYARSAIGFDGVNFVVVAEGKVAKDGPDRTRLEIRGWVVSPEGKVICGGKSGFIVSPVEKYEQVLPAVCGGPKGVSLVVNSELRGVDDLKLVARIIKTHE